MWRSIKELEPELKVDRSSTNWRAGPRYYRSSPDNLLKPGVANMSPAWFEQGHDVCQKETRQGFD
jgi:hypothetical protein